MIRVADVLLGVLAVIGVFIIIGAVGKMDYMTNSYTYYPLIETVKSLIVGGVCIVPVCIRYVWR